jgi:exopolysaccharide production protein ExoZ
MKTNENIQYLRGAAALSVVMAHTLSTFTEFKDVGGFMSVILNNLVLVGQVGVGVFFIISGYIMSMTTVNKTGGGGNAGKFIFKRAVRIYPIYFIWTSVLIGLWYFGFILKSHEYTSGKIIASYLLLPYISFKGDVIDPILRQGWTLIYEAFYYLAFAGLILFDKHRKRGIYILTAFFILLNILSEFVTSPTAQSFFSIHDIYLFVVGMFIFQHQHRLLQAIKTKASRWLLLLLFCVLLATITLKDAAMGDYAQYVHYLAAVVFFLYIFTARQVSGWVLEIGNSSYSLYLTHGFVAMAYAVLARSGRFGTPMLIVLGVVTFMVAVIVGEISYRLIERRLIFKRSTVAPAAS